ncbi:MAG: type IV pilin protein [Rubrivivax sp.]|nr:type IV pilin protein [Rubrivivax sp.]
MPTARTNHPSTARGFTLIEMMIAIVLMAILTTVALPSYRDSVVRGQIGDATANLQDMRTQSERYFQDQRTYVGMPCTATSATANFAFSCSTAATTYTITATGSSAMSGFTYTINETNTRRTTALPTGWSGASGTSTCWVRRKDGAC